MELRKKWKSQEGASILMALLFLLVAVMVSSSVLAAAVSNAGKYSSNRQAQQRYLALSSAVRLICDELARAEYYGKYEYEEIILYGEDEEDGSEGPIEEVEYCYTQTEGEYRCGLKEVLPLREDFDYMFARTFPSAQEWKEESGDESVFFRKTYETLPGLLPEPHGENNPHKMILKVDAPEEEEWGRVPALKEEVLIEIWLSHVSENGYTLRLRASLGDEDDRGHVYKMEAELTQTGTVPMVNDNPGEGDGEYSAGPMTWTLGWIAKEEADGDGA